MAKFAGWTHILTSRSTNWAASTLARIPNAPQYAVQNTYQLEDNVSWIKGNHSFKFGIDLRKQIDPQLFIQRARGDYEYDLLSIRS